MGIYLSAGVSTLVALMAAHRVAGRGDGAPPAPFDQSEPDEANKDDGDSIGLALLKDIKIY